MQLSPAVAGLIFRIHTDSLSKTPGQGQNDARDIKMKGGEYDVNRLLNLDFVDFRWFISGDIRMDSKHGLPDYSGDFSDS
ncbi:hypothetical protein A3D78_07030 [Candidatus Gottesmanbacteria bacterium RIFCSPHIGHO2_02_FULL_39_14]|uniref:Uncharacterized protein n=2 Tax=Candidatus Gottesmaniibacteriota TaxID=1752720 RepID=A0A1F5ZU95_9BACT|nr:MAG: hypothetical protein A3D78_07030 [Candidatus Gottesmanbacteria bacterium RIFCSPHIGHO2_02_FULL_39_14]OGG31216.1 MAG: hypothetical protein A3I51_05085 [Candidatus Gottesmanbacteria bacterium RIFCSPLOWO2_02_FULL_38_8]